MKKKTIKLGIYGLLSGLTLLFVFNLIYGGVEKTQKNKEIALEKAKQAEKQLKEANKVKSTKEDIASDIDSLFSAKGDDVVKDEKTATGKENNGTGKLDINAKIKKEKEEKKRRLEILKKRFTIKGAIIKGDYYVNNNQHIEGLAKYLQAYKKSPNDEKVIKKIGDVYFLLKNYKKAFEFYTKILNYKKLDKEMLVLSLFYSKNLGDKKDQTYISTFINKLAIENELKFYYLNSLNCLIDFHACKVNFQKYFEKGKVKSKQNENINFAIKSYQNFKTDDKYQELYYKNSLIIKGFYENELYPMVIELGNNILKEKKEYKPMMLLIGKSYFEIGQIEKAKEILTKYYEEEPNNVQVTYLLGEITFKLKDYETSNMYFNAAITNGYKPKTNLERKLVYNYFLLDNKTLMLNTFAYLLKEKDATIDDFALGIFNAIEEKKYSTALKRTNRALNQYPKEEIFYAYLGWIYRIQKKLDIAEKNLKFGIKLNPRSSIINLNLGLLSKDKKNWEKAMSYFKKTILTNAGGEFGIIAQKNIEEIEPHYEAWKKEEEEKRIQKEVEEDADDELNLGELLKDDL